MKRFRTVRIEERVAEGMSDKGVMDQNHDAARASKSLTIAAKAKSIEVRPRV